MQAHLATRIGRWDKTSDRSARAIELEREYHRVMNVKPRDDHQFSHHLEILLLSLIHDGRFREARAIKEEAFGHGYKFCPVVGEILADLAIDGSTKHDIGLFRIDRFT